MFYSPLRTFAVRRLATYPARNGPYRIAFDGASVWVTNSRDNTVSKF